MNSPAKQAEIYVTLTRKLSVMRDDLEAIATIDDMAVTTSERIRMAIYAVGQVEADLRATAMISIAAAGRQPPLF